MSALCVKIEALQHGKSFNMFKNNTFHCHLSAKVRGSAGSLSKKTQYTR